MTTNEPAFKWIGDDGNEQSFICEQGPSEGWSCPICGATHGRLDSAFKARGVPNNFWEQWKLECFDCGQIIEMIIRPQKGDAWLTDFRRKTDNDDE